MTEKTAFGPVFDLFDAAAKGQAQTKKTRLMLQNARMLGRPVIQPMTGKMVLAGLQKQANVSPGRQIATGLGIAIATGAGAALATEGVRALGRGVSRLTGGLGHDRLFNDLLARHQELRQNKVEARKHFDIIMEYAPSMARNHVVISDFIKRQLQYQTSSVEFIRQLTDLESTIRGHIDRGSVAGRVSDRAGQVADNYLGNALSNVYAMKQQKK